MGPIATDANAAPDYATAAKSVLDLPRSAEVLLVCHVNPDGDALGSMLAVALGLRQLGFTGVQASFPEPFEVPAVFDFLAGQELLTAPARAYRSPQLAMSFDAASTERLGELVGNLAAAPTWLMLDHHGSNPGFGTLPLLDPAAAATASVAARLLDELEVSFDAAIATALYVGLATDTGSFKFDATTPEVHLLAARLVAAGAKPAEVARRVFDTRPFGAIRLLAQVLGRVELDRSAGGGRGLITSYATEEDLRRHGQPAQALESFMDVLRTVADADVACLVKPAGAGVWAVSLRSRGSTNVGAVAVALGGGGHRLAAGFTGYGGVEDVLAALRAALPADEDRG